MFLLHLAVFFLEKSVHQEPSLSYTRFHVFVYMASRGRDYSGFCLAGSAEGRKCKPRGAAAMGVELVNDMAVGTMGIVVIRLGLKVACNTTASFNQSVVSGGCSSHAFCHNGKGWSALIVQLCLRRRDYLKLWGCR
jgi:hypothetical protein